MHCVSMYPTPNVKANLNMIQFMKKNYKSAIIGYSDHTLGIKACEYAALMGAEIIEKHFTLNKKFSKFRDHKLSADPKEFKEMVNNIKLIYQMKGSVKDKLSKEELSNKIGMRVFVNNKRNNTGVISLEYKAVDQLDRLVEIIKKNY